MKEIVYKKKEMSFTHGEWVIFFGCLWVRYMVHHLHTDFTLKDCFSGAIKLNKNAYRKIFSLNTLINILILNAVFDLIHDYFF